MPITADFDILIADDEPAILVTLKKIVSGVAPNARIATARDGSEARKFLENQTVDILLTDIDMPNMSGLELCRAVKSNKRTAETYCIVLTGLTAGDQQTKALQYGADDFIERLPEKYNTQIRERGSNLSVGQKQLISFARALAINPDILILDEATSSVDAETEQLIEESIARLLKGRSSIVIAHRLSTVQRADVIIAMHQGEIREIGSHSELLAANGLYAKLYRYQYGISRRTAA